METLDRPASPVAPPSARTEALETQLWALVMAMDRIYGHSAWARHIVKQEFGTWTRKRDAVLALLEARLP